MKTEEWQPIPSYPIYEASSLGRIRRIGGQFLTPTLCKQGYARVSISPTPNKRYTAKVATLVADAFLGLRPAEYHVHHIDGNPANDVPENLVYMCRWKHYTTRISCVGTHHGNSKLTDESVRMIRQLYPYVSQNKLADIYSVKRSTIYTIVNCRAWTHI